MLESPKALSPACLATSYLHLLWLYWDFHMQVHLNRHLLGDVVSAPHVSPWYLPFHSQRHGTQSFLLEPPSFLPEGFLRPPASEEVRNQWLPENLWINTQQPRCCNSDAYSLLLPEGPAGVTTTPTQNSDLCNSMFISSLWSYFPTSRQFFQEVSFQIYYLQMNPFRVSFWGDPN